MADALAGGVLARGFDRAKLRWSAVRASDLFELQYGKALTESTRRPGDVPVYGTNGQTGSHDTPLFRGPGVVLGRKGMGNLGVEWVDSDFWVIDTAYALKLRCGLELKFAYYLIKFVGLNHLKAGTSNPSLTRDVFGAQLFPVPPISAQRAIADVLTALDDKIAANTKLATTSDELARSEAIRLMRASRAQVLLGDIAVLSYGKALPATKRVPGPYPVYGSGGVGGYHDSYLKPGPGVILGRKGSVGEVYWSEEPFFPIDTTFFVVPKAQVPLSYLYYAIEQQKFGDNNSDSAVPGLNRDDAYRTRVPVPDSGGLDQFDELAVQLRRVVHQANVESRRLATIRDALMPALMSGRLTVRDAESAVEGAVSGVVEPDGEAGGKLW